MKKSTLFAALIFVALLAGAWLTMRDKPERGITRISFAEVDPDAITKIVATGKKSAELRKDGDVWRLPDGKRADAAGVKRLLEAVPRVQSGNVVTQSDARFAELEVDEQKGLRIQAFAGEKEVADFVIGKASRGGVNVRVDDAVYAVRGVVPSLFDRDAAAWVEKALFDVNADDVERVEVALANGTKYALVRSGPEWVLEDPSVLPEGFRFDGNQARTLANSVIHARAKTVLDADPGAETTKLEGTADTFTFVDKSGTRRSLVLGGQTEQKDVYARADGWDTVVTMYPQSERALRKAPTDMRDLALMKVDVEKAKKLEIEKGKSQLVFEKQGDTWKIASSTEKAPEGFDFDPTKVGQRLIAMSSSRAVAPAGKDAKTGLAKPAATVRATLEDGSVATLAFGETTQHDGRDVVYAQGNADQEAYVVTPFVREDMTRGLDSFARSEETAGGMPQIDPAELAKLPPDVRAQVLKQLEQEQLKQRAVQGLQVKTQ